MSSSQQQPLVEGGRVKRIPTSSIFYTHVFPAIYANTIIVAATHPNTRLGNPTLDGWFLSDFYAFNYLLKDAVAQQTWLTAVDPETLLFKYGDFLHGNPFHDRKVVLSRDLLKTQLTPVTVIRSNRMITAFLDKVKQACAMARKEDAPVLLLVFCHGHENSHFLLDAGNNDKGLSIQTLKGVIDPAVRVTLLSTACYSGAWAVTPDLNFTVLAAADEKSVSHSWCAISEEAGGSGRYSGSVFISTTIAALSDVTTPLLQADNQQQQPSAATAQAMDDSDTCLQPEEADESQTLTFNSFCHSIRDVLRSEMTRLWLRQTFTFSAADDQWGFSWAGRTGIPVRRFEDRWAALPVVASKLPLWQFANPDPANELFQEGAQTLSTTGGRGQPMFEEVAASIIRQQTKEMVRLFLKTCPGDWTGGQNTALCGDLNMFLKDDPDCEYSAGQVREIMSFRWELALQADRIVEEVGLPVPNDQVCIFWDEYQFKKRMCETISSEEYNARDLAAWKTLLSGGCNIRPAKTQGPPFPRFMSYLSAAITAVDGSPEERTALAHRVCDSVALLKKFYRDRALESPEVVRRGRDWLETLRQKVTHSEPPSKPRISARKPLSEDTFVPPVVSELPGSSAGAKMLEKMARINPFQD